MNQVWAHLWDISPLLCCLPGHTWHIQEKKDDGVSKRSLLTFVSVPLPHEWARFQHHAARVKALKMPTNSGRYVLHQSCFDALEHCPTLRPLPSLTRLSSSDDIPPGLLPAARLFFPKTLVSLRWSCSTAAGYLRLLTFLNSLDLPRLRELVIIPHFLDCDEDYDSLLLDAEAVFHELYSSGKFSGITSIAVGSLWPEGLRALAMIPRLQCLDLALHSSDVQGNDFDFQGGFNTLTELCLRASVTEPRLFVRFLENPRSHIPSLLKLNLSLFALPFLEDHSRAVAHACTMQELFESIALIDTLESLSVYTISLQTVCSLAHETLELDTFAPLFRLRRLRELDLTNLVVSLAPADVEKVAKGFPRIERLFLGSLPWFPIAPARRPAQPLISAHDLLPFAAHCRHLVTLGISISLRARPHPLPSGVADLDSPSPAPTAKSASMQTILLSIFAPSGELDAESSQVLAEAFPHASVSLVHH